MSLNMNAWKTALAGLYNLVYTFRVVQNSPTQFFQRDSLPPVVAVIKYAGRKSKVKVTWEAGYNPAINPKTGERGKRNARLMFNIMRAGRYDKDSTVLKLSADLIAWCGAKIVTSRSRSLEGALMSMTLNHLEDAGAKLESVTLRDELFKREAIEAKRDELLLNYEVMLDNNLITNRESQRGVNLSEDTVLSL